MERKKRVVPAEVCVKASRSFNRIWKERDRAQPKLLEAILYKDNLNRAYKRVKANKGVAGIDGMSIEEALPYLKEHQQELINRILRGKYTPSPVRRVEIPKPDVGLQSEILNSLALHWEGTEQAFMSEFIRSHGRSLSRD